MYFKTIIIIFINVFLTILGAWLGNLFQEPKNNLDNIYWLVVLILNGMFSTYIYNEFRNKNDQAKTADDQMTKLMIKKEFTKQLDLAVYSTSQYDSLKIGFSECFFIFINSPYKIDDFPELLIKSNKEAIININNNNIPYKKYASMFQYIINKDLLSNPTHSKKFFFYKINIEAKEEGEHDFYINAANKSLTTQSHITLNAYKIRS